MSRWPDALSVALLLGLAVALLGCAAALAASGVIKPWELVAIIAGGGVLVAAAHPRQPPTPVRNTYAHGAARVANESEARNAATRSGSAKPLDAMEFND